jgi:histidinol phosphatase-like PHP family hydrolase
MSVAAILERTRAEGYAAVGVVEHLDTAPKHPLSCLEALVAEFRRLSPAVDAYVGAELDYRGDAITIPDAAVIKRTLGLDYYLAAAHGAGDGVDGARAYAEDQYRRLMGILSCDYVDVVAHPWSGGHSLVRRGVLEHWSFGMIPEQMLRQFVQATGDSGKAIELNRKALADVDDPAFAAYLRLLRDRGVAVSIGSDAHAMSAIGGTDELVDLIREAGLLPAQLWRPPPQHDR